LRLLRRYIISRFLRIFFLALASFAGVYLLVDFFERFDNLLNHQARPIHYILYFSGKIPLIISQITPLAVLLGVFLSIGTLARTQELTAMRAGGISLTRITSPLLKLSLAIVLLLFGINEYIVPAGLRMSQHIYEVQVKGKEDILNTHRLWFREGDSVFHILAVVPQENLLRGISIFRFDEQFRLLARTDAPAAVYRDGEWVLQNAVIRSFDSASTETSTERLPEKPIHLEKAPEDFGAPMENEEMGYRQLRKLVRKFQNEGYDATRYRVDMQARLAAPFSVLIMAVLGIPFALQKGRHSGLAMGVALAVGIGTAYHLLQTMLMAFGYSGILSPLPAAWSAHLLFGFIGIWLLLKTGEA